jgi:hypothetical protein
VGRLDLPPALQDDAVASIGSVNDMYFDQDRVTVSQGRMADPRSDNEFVATAEAAHLLGWHVGEVVPMGAFTLQQVNSPDLRQVQAVLSGLGQAGRDRRVPQPGGQR